MTKQILSFLATLALMTTQAHAGAWVQAEGHGLLVANATYFADDHYYNSDGNLVKQPRYQKYEAQPYLEYGLLTNLTIGGTAFLQHDEQSGISNNGLADPTIFARSVIWKDDKQVVSLQPLIKFSSSFERDGPPRGGSYSTDYELSALYGRSLNITSNRDYIDLRVGYRYRGDALNDQLQGDAALGLGLGERWMLVPAIRTITSTGTSTGPFVENGDQDYNLFKVELGLAYTLSKTQLVSLTIADHVAGEQTGNGMGVTLSFAQNF